MSLHVIPDSAAVTMNQAIARFRPRFIEQSLVAGIFCKLMNLDIIPDSATVTMNQAIARFKPRFIEQSLVAGIFRVRIRDQRGRFSGVLLLDHAKVEILHPLHD